MLYLADAVDAAWGRGAGLRLVVVGSRLDDAYSTLVQERAEKSPGAFILLPEVLSRDACIELMRHCAAVVNSSTSEGMSGALLEALATGTPVLARRIPGNVALADMARKAGGGTAGSTSASVGGVVIYDTPEHFIRQSEALFLAGSLQVDPGATGADGVVEQTAGIPTPPICLSAADLGADGLKAAQTMAVDERIAWNAVLDAVVSSTQTFDSASTTGRPVG